MKKKLVMVMIGVMLLTSFAGCGNKKAVSHDAGAKVEQSAKDSAKSKTKAAKQKTGEEKKWFVYYYGLNNLKKVDNRDFQNPVTKDKMNPDTLKQTFSAESVDEFFSTSDKFKKGWLKTPSESITDDRGDVKEKDQTVEISYDDEVFEKSDVGAATSMSDAIATGRYRAEIPYYGLSHEARVNLVNGIDPTDVQTGREDREDGYDAEYLKPILKAQSDTLKAFFKRVGAPDKVVYPLGVDAMSLTASSGTTVRGLTTFFVWYTDEGTYILDVTEMSSDGDFTDVKLSAPLWFYPIKNFNVFDKNTPKSSWKEYLEVVKAVANGSTKDVKVDLHKLFKEK